MSNPWGGRITATDFSERWMGDALRIAESGGAFGSLLVDMTACAALMKQLRREGQALTYTPVIICAVARALSRHPNLQKLVAGNRKLIGGRIDICLSIGSEEVLTPVVILTEPHTKTPVEIAAELRLKIRQARSDADTMHRRLKTWGRLVPLGLLRRMILRTLLNRIGYRRMLSGMLQVTIVPGIDGSTAQAFNTAAVLAVGGIKERPMVVNGQVIPRLSGVFTCTIDHKQWNGGNGVTFLSELQKILETEAELLFASSAPATRAASA